MSVVYIIAVLFINNLQSTIYFSSLIKSFYYYQPNEPAAEERSLAGTIGRSILSKILPSTLIHKKMSSVSSQIDLNDAKD